MLGIIIFNQYDNGIMSKMCALKYLCVTVKTRFWNTTCWTRRVRWQRWQNHPLIEFIYEVKIPIRLLKIYSKIEFYYKFEFSSIASFNFSVRMDEIRVELLRALGFVSFQYTYLAHLTKKSLSEGFSVRGTIEFYNFFAIFFAISTI